MSTFPWHVCSCLFRLFSSIYLVSNVVSRFLWICLRKYNLPVDGGFLFAEAGIRNIQNSLQGKLVYKQLVDENSCEI